MDKGNLDTLIGDIRRAPLLIKVVLAILGTATVGLAGYGWFQATQLDKVQTELASTTLAFVAERDELRKQIEDLVSENDELRDDLRGEKRRNDNFEEQIEEITGTVNVLEKLRKTDEELLKKYSKVSFLNEHYLPEGLVEIDDTFVAGNEVERIHKRVASFLEDMLEDAEDDGHDLRIVSAYRSFGTQAALKNQYTVVYGSGANQFSADQGYSEHQLGTAIDVSVPAMNGALDGFEKTEAYQWLLDNAQKYGFVLSYPPGNAYYQFEPWHWRFVGVDLAKDLKRDGKYFYDWDQRDINTYLVKIFD